jgi:GNAT superfamily N-acetyltransferase
MMAMSLVIRKYREDDREQCRALWRELTEWHREIYLDPTIGREHPEDYFDKHLAKVGPARLWVAIHDFTVVGLVGLIVGEDEAEIEPLIVSKAYRGKGIGKQLIETVAYEARRIGVRFLCIKPVARNVKTIKLLYKRGFKTLGHIELFMDLSNQTWKSGPEIFNCKFSF